MMWSKFSKKIICIMTAMLLVGLSPMSVKALTQEQLEMFAQNNILFYDPPASACVDEADMDYDEERNASIVIGMLMQAGYTHDSALAIAGNIKRESSFNTRVIEGGKIVEDGWRAWNNGAKTFKGGFGLVQWTYWSRVKGLQEYADENNWWVGTLRAQIGFMVKELSGGFSPEKLNALSLEKATWQIYKNYERPASSFEASSYEALSPTGTPTAWRAYHARLNAAKNLASLTPTQLSSYCVGSGNSGLAETAVNMAWPNEDGTCRNGSSIIDWTKNRKACYDDVKPAYREAMIKALGRDPNTLHYYQDCGHFVSAAIKSSGTDSDFPNTWTKSMLNYLSSSSKWQEIVNLENTTNLEPGDVMIIRNKSDTGGHIMMYTGDYSKYGDLASASLDERTGNMGKVYFHDVRGRYRIFRFVGGN